MIATTLCYIKNNKDEYLLLHRVKKVNDINEGKWIGVGGKLEEGETPDQCVVREVYEETGLTLTNYHCHGLVKFISDQYEAEDMYLYSADGYEGSLIEDCNEGELVWVHKDKVLELPTWEGDKYFLKPLLEGQNRIDMLVEYKGDELVRCENLASPVNTIKSNVLTYPHGFSTRTGGVSEGIYKSLNLGMKLGDDWRRVWENYNRFLSSVGIKQRDFVCGNQVHGNSVHIATSKDLRVAYGKGNICEVDGYVTNEPGVPIVVFTADCVPVLLEDRKHGVIGALHCGWRSTVADIEKEGIDKMVLLGARKENIHIAIGPAIEASCFEVGSEVVEAAEKLIGGAASRFYEKETDKVTGEIIRGKFLLNLKGIIKERFTQLGVKEEFIEIINECTMCNPDKFWSHRYTKGQRGSQASIISIPPLK